MKVIAGLSVTLLIIEMKMEKSLLTIVVLHHGVQIKVVFVQAHGDMQN